MNSLSRWLPVIGLTATLLLFLGLYSLSPAPNTAAVAQKSPPIGAIPSSAGLPAPTADSAPSPPPQPSPASAPSYQYNPQGQVQAITYPDGSTYTYLYDAHGDKIRETDRSGKAWSYVYDQSQHPIAVIDPRGSVTRNEVPPSTPNAN